MTSTAMTTPSMTRTVLVNTLVVHRLPLHAYRIQAPIYQSSFGAAPSEQNQSYCYGDMALWA